MMRVLHCSSREWARTLGGAAVILGVLTSLGGLLYVVTST
jgi:hypothetical protein